MRKYLVILLAGLLGLFSCSREREQEGIATPESSPEGKQVTITLSVPGFEPDTKSLDEGGTLESLRLAVFGGSGYLKEYVEAVPVRTTDYTYSTLDKDGNSVSHTVPCYNFTVTLAMSDSPRSVHFLGNGPEIMPFGYDTAVMPVQLCSNGEMGYWQRIDLPNGIRAKRNAEGYFIDKYGEIISNDAGYFPSNFPVPEDRGKTRYVADDATELAFQGIPLIRNWAKIVLSASEDSFFTPISLAVVNVPSRGSMAPYSASTGFIDLYQDRSFVYLEDEVQYPGNLPSGTTFDDTIPEAADFEYFKTHPGQAGLHNGVANANGGAVYLYERPAPNSAIPPTYVIIYGHYRNPDELEREGDYFYKVDLMENKLVETIGDEEHWEARYYPIYRNFKYQILVKKILSQGQATPAAAAASAGSADVSADVTTSHLSDISDGVGRLNVTPWMAKTFTREHGIDNPVTELAAYFIKSSEAGPDMSASTVTVELLPTEDGGPDIIGNLSIAPPYDPSQHDDPDVSRKGWRAITFTTPPPGRTVRTQTIRVTGRHDYGRLYRDVIVTIQPVQPMMVTCAEERIAAEKYTPQSVVVSIPDGLVESMFPLEFIVEPQDQSLSPDNTKPDNNLPVDDDEQVWRSFTCWFLTNRDESATKVWVYNEFFDKASDSFNIFKNKTFKNLHFTIPIPEESDVVIPLTFEMVEDPDLVYPMSYPEITIKPTGLRLEGEGVMPGVENDTYTFKPTSHTVTLNFISTTSYADEFSVTLTADEYSKGYVQTYRFPMVQLMDGHPLSKNTTGWADNSWSNVAWGHVNQDNTKAVLFGYKDHPDQLNTPITVTITSGLKEPKVQGSTVTFPYTPTGPRNVNGDKNYHEIEFRTISGLRDVMFTLSSPGYITEHIGQVAIDFSEISSEPAGYVLFDPGGTYTLTLTSQYSAQTLFYVDFFFDYAGGVVYAPETFTPSVGTIERYPGSNNQFVWSIPRGNLSATLTFTAPENRRVRLNTMYIKAMNGDLYEDGVVVP